MKTVPNQKGLFFGVPTLGRPTPVQWGLAIAAMRPPINYSAVTGVVWGQEVAHARNGMCQNALDADTEFTFFLGDDVTGPGHGLSSLIYRMKQHPEIGVVGGIYCSKSEPSFPLVFRGNGRGAYWDWKAGEFFEVTGIGMDFTLIRNDLLKQLGPPWFKTIQDSGYLDGESSEERWTEDLYFCNRVLQETDYKIYADGLVLCDHWHYMGRNQWKTFTLRKDSYPMQRAKIEGKQILDLGCGPNHWDFGTEGQVTRCDLRDECEPDYRCDLRVLPFGPESYDVVFSSHVLEHFGRDEVKDLLIEWLKVLKPDGEFRIVVPNLEWAAKEIVAGRTSWDALNVLYGSQEYPLNFHKNGFTPLRLRKMLEDVGLEVVNEETKGYNILMTALFRKHVLATTFSDNRLAELASGFGG